MISPPATESMAQATCLPHSPLAQISSHYGWLKMHTNLQHVLGGSEKCNVFAKAILYDNEKDVHHAEFGFPG